MRRLFLDFLKDESGAAASVYILASTALIIMAGVAYDYAQVATLDTELQSAADQAAIAGATQLAGQTGQIAAAQSAATNLLTNRTLMANDGGNSRVAIASSGFAFYATKADAEAGSHPITDANDTTARFIKVAVVARKARYTLTPILSLLPMSPSINASATAGIGSAICNSPPIMMCNPAESTDPNFTQNYVGKGLRLVAVGGGGGLAPGNFGYLSVGDNNGQPITELSKALGWTSPPGTCLDESTATTKPGANTPVTDAINTRFDIYDNNACPTGGSCPPSLNSRKDVILNSNHNSCGTTGQGWHEGSVVYQTDASGNPLATPTNMGHPRDRCHAYSSTGNCPNGIIGDGNWDRATYFGVNYPGFDWASAMTSAFGNTTPTRHQVYLWEITHSADTYVNTTTGATTTIGGVRVAETAKNGTTESSYLGPVCSPPGLNPVTGPIDRRTFPVAVVNCLAQGVSGQSQVSILKWLNVFLVEPSLNRTGRTQQSEVYVEVVSQNTLTNNDGGAAQVVRRAKPYLVK